MRRRGAFEVARNVGAQYESRVPESELIDVHVDEFGRAFSRSTKPAPVNIVPVPSPDGDSEGRRLVGVEVDGAIVRGFPTPSGKLEFYLNAPAIYSA